MGPVGRGDSARQRPGRLSATGSERQQRSVGLYERSPCGDVRGERVAGRDLRIRGPGRDRGARHASGGAGSRRSAACSRRSARDGSRRRAADRVHDECTRRSRSHGLGQRRAARRRDEHRDGDGDDCRGSHTSSTPGDRLRFPQWTSEAIRTASSMVPTPSMRSVTEPTVHSSTLPLRRTVSERISPPGAT